MTAEVRYQEINPSIFTLPKATIKKYVYYMPDEMRKAYNESDGDIPHISKKPSVEDFDLTSDYNLKDYYDEKSIEKKHKKMLLVLYIIGFILSILLAVYLQKMNNANLLKTILVASLGTVFLYNLFVVIVFGAIFGNKIEKRLEMKKKNTPLKPKIKAYGDAYRAFNFWYSVSLLYHAENNPPNSNYEKRKEKMNALDAHRMVHEYFELIGKSNGGIPGFPCTELSFYDENWKDTLFDAAKIWFAHAILYDERSEDEIKTASTLLACYNNGMPAWRYERKKRQFDIYVKTNGQEASFPSISMPGFDHDIYIKYEKLLSEAYSFRKELKQKNYLMGYLPFWLICQYCIDIYNETGVEFRCEYVPFFESFDYMRRKALSTSRNIYSYYKNYLNTHK